MISATFCSICGEDTDMGNPQAIIPGSDTISCELLDRAGRIGIIPDHECHLLLHFSTLCECNSLLTIDPDELSRQLYVDNDDNAPITVPLKHVSPVFDLVDEDDSTKDWDYIDDDIRTEMENMDKLEFNKTAPMESQKIDWDDEPSPSEIDYNEIQDDDDFMSIHNISQSTLSDDKYLDDDFQDDTFMTVNGNMDSQNEQDPSFDESS